MTRGARNNRGRFAALGLGVLVAGAPAALAQKAPDADPPAQPLRVNREGEYGGVTPGVVKTAAGEARPRGKRGRASGKATISWIGFQQRTAGGARLFVQLGSAVPSSQTVVGSALLIHLDGARLGSRNSKRALDVRFFESTVQRIEPKAVGSRRTRKGQPGHKAGVELRVEFKSAADAAQAAASATTEQDGYHYLYFDFPTAPAAQGSITPPKRRQPGDPVGG